MSNSASPPAELGVYLRLIIITQSNGVFGLCAFLFLCEIRKFISRKPRVHFPEAVDHVICSGPEDKIPNNQSLIALRGDSGVGQRFSKPAGELASKSRLRGLLKTR